MRQHNNKILAAAVLAVSAPAFAQVPVVDGTLDAAYGPAIAVQQVQTGFGDFTVANQGGSELDAAYALISGGRLYVMLTGNLERNFNKLELYIDSKPGGENVLSATPEYDFRTGDGWNSTFQGGMKFDAGFGVDYHLFGRSGGGTGNGFEVDFVDRQGGTNAQVPGSVGTGSPFIASTSGFASSGTIPAGNVATYSTVSALTSSLDFALDNSNELGVTGGTGAADQAAALAVTTGFEFSIALADIGYTGGALRISAAINNSDHRYLSNQFLGALPAGTGNLGGNGTGAFTGTLSGIDLTAFAGDQFFTVVAGTPSFVLGDFGGAESPDGSLNTPDDAFNEFDVEGFLLALNDQAAYLTLNPTLGDSLTGRGDFGGAESTDGSLNTPDGSFNEFDVEGFLLALNDPAGYAAIQPAPRIAAIPEPAALGLLAPMGLLLARRRR